MMLSIRRLFLLLGLFALLSLTVSLSTEAAVPVDFSESVYVGGLNNPTSMAFAPDGRLFVTQQGGALRVIKNDALLPTPFITLTVNSAGERGLLGVAFDPNFTSNRFIYLYYTVPGTPPHNRVSRFTADAVNGDIVQAGSELILLELENLTGATNHNGGALHFGPDGMLYVAVGENANGANSQTLANKLGKILRITSTGGIPADNPFVGTPGAEGEIWALGLRNPFTFAFQPGTGLMYINDVGEVTFEEINVGAAGANYGWNTSEGPAVLGGQTAPLFFYTHSGAVNNSGCAIAGGAFYNPATVQFPADYIGDYFFADYCNDWIKRYDIGTATATNFLTASMGVEIVDVQIGPDGALYYLSRNPDGVYRVQYLPGIQPTITQDPSNAIVGEGQPANFTCSASGAPTITYRWQRDNVDIVPPATGSSYTLNPTTLADNGAQFRCVATNGFGNDTSANATLTVTSNTPPVATINNPVNNSNYNAGDTLSFDGFGTDVEDVTIPASRMTWWIDFHHDAHTHPAMLPTSDIASGTFVIPNSNEVSDNVFYRIHLTVQDSGGLTHSVYHDVLPNKVNLTVQTTPPGLQLDVDTNTVTAPNSFLSVVGVIRTISAPLNQNMGGTDYVFQNWSDSGAASHTITTPAADNTYTAVYAAIIPSTPPVATITTPLNNSFYNAGDTLNFAGTGTDAEDGILPPSAFSWQIDFHHDGSVDTAVFTFSGVDSGSFSIPNNNTLSDNVFYRIHLTVQDSGFLTNSVYHDVLPNKVNITVQTDPAGLQLQVDANPLTAPNSFLSVVGILHTIAAPSPQNLAGTDYEFQSWSDSGIATHTITTPVTDVTFIAIYAPVSNPVVNPPTNPPSTNPPSAPSNTAAAQTTTTTFVDSAFISKNVDKSLAAIGDTLIYTINFTNPKGISLRQVVISDVFDARFDNVRVLSNSIGSATINGNSLILQGFELLPGQSGSVAIQVTISNRAHAGDVITNIATLESPDASIHVSNAATVTILPGTLPSTGESQWSAFRLPLLALMLLLCVGVVVRYRGRRYIS